jgi:endo-1,3-1,4-beta-glycanase ExoK
MMDLKFFTRKQRIIMQVVGITCIVSLLSIVAYAFVNGSQRSHAATGSWQEGFDGNSVNTDFWRVSNEPYGMATIENLHEGYFQPDRVSVNQGYLTVALTQENGKVGTNQNGVISRGGEVETKAAYGYGTYEWRMRVSSTASSPTDTTGKVVSGQISSGFTYINNSQSELDFEVEGQFPDQAEMTTWHNTHPSTDPTEQDQTYSSAKISKMANEFKTYKAVWSANEVKYYIDDQLVADHTSHVPSVAAPVLINHWGTDSGDFGGLATVGTTRYLLIDWVRYTSPDDTTGVVSTPTSVPTTTPVSTTPAVTATVPVATIPAVTATVSVPTIPALTATVPVSTIPVSTATVPASTANLLQGGAFADKTLSPWYFAATGVATGSVQWDGAESVDGNGSARVDVTKSDREDVWHAQFGQMNVKFVRGYNYAITFWAKASLPRTGQLYIQRGAGPWTKYLVQKFSLTTMWTKYSYSFTPTVDVTSAEFNFNLAQATGSVWIDNVSVI